VRKECAGSRWDHVDVVFNAGHPNVAEPHYHGEAALASLALPPWWRAPAPAAKVVEIAMRSDQLGSKVSFDPVGLFGELGTTVGTLAGTGAPPFDYFTGKAGTANWLAVPAAAQRAFPGVERIARERRVRGGGITE
jgi:hypothetical protein